MVLVQSHDTVILNSTDVLILSEPISRAVIGRGGITENATFILRGDDNCALQIMKDIITQQKSRNSFYYLFCDIEAEIKIG